MVPSDLGILPESRGVTGTPRGKCWAYMSLKGERGKPAGGGTRPLPLSYSDSPWGGPPPCGMSPLSPMAHDFPRGVLVTPRYSGKIAESFGTIPLSEYNLPIYESLPLDHFETPRHVRDIIRDSEQTSVTKTHNS